jgi:cytochrome c oxidase cbb3-type subunit I/II
MATYYCSSNNTLPLGYSSSNMPELEWPIDIAIAFIWVVMGINMIGTMIKKKRASLICSNLVLLSNICYGSSFTYFQYLELVSCFQ